MGARLPPKICGAHLRLRGEASVDRLAIGGLGRPPTVADPPVPRQTVERFWRKHDLYRASFRDLGEKRWYVGRDQVRRPLLNEPGCSCLAESLPCTPKLLINNVLNGVLVGPERLIQHHLELHFG